jgi:hypothetical protein
MEKIITNALKWLKKFTNYKKNKTEINKLLKKRSKYIQIRSFSFSLTTRDRSFESAETLRKNAI